MIHFTAPQVAELVEAADHAAFLQRHQHEFFSSVLVAREQPEPDDDAIAYCEEVGELLPRWDEAVAGVKRDPHDRAAWDALFLVAGAILAWMRSDPTRWKRDA